MEYGDRANLTMLKLGETRVKKWSQQDASHSKEDVSEAQPLATFIEVSQTFLMN